MKIESKSLYLAVALALLALISVPSAFFISTARNYFGFLSHWSDGVLRPVLAPHSQQTVMSAVKVYPPELKFVRFTFTRKGAKAVSIAADFNDWNPAALPMKEEDKGTWIAVMPLPKGTYRYLFVADSVPLADPANPRKILLDGKEVSIITIQ